MRLLGKFKIEEFIRKHPKTKNALLRWVKLIESNSFHSMAKLRQTFPSADFVKGKTVFNVGGNKVRAITLIEYGVLTISVLDILTHKEYDRGQWK